MVEVDRAERGPAELGAFDAVAARLNSGWHHYGKIKGFAGGSAITGGPVPTEVEHDARAPVVTREWRASVDEAFVEPDEFAMARAVLERRHVVVLQGLARCGKTWMAAQLLESMPVQHSPRCVYAVADLPDPLEAHTGYLVDDLGAREAEALDVRAVRGLEDRARAAKSYVVLTVDDEVAVTRAAAALLVPCSGTPDAARVLERGLDAHYGRDRPEGLAALLDSAWVQGFLRARPLPGAVAQLVDTIVAEDGDAAAVRARFERARAYEVAQWFRRYPTVKDRCFMVAAAVFQDSSLDRVDVAARSLEERFGSRGASNPSWRLLSPRVRRLRAIGAGLVEEPVWTPAGVVATLVVKFEPSWVPGAVLRHVWEEHDDAREAVVSWLKQFAIEDAEEDLIHLPAAAALGVVGREDVGWLSQTVQQWVWARTPITRDAAGIALAALGRERAFGDQLMPGLYRRVREDPASPRSAVAAVVYGLLPHEATIDQALRDLRSILATSPRRIPVVARSMAMLCESELSETVLDALCAWTRTRTPGAFDVLVRLMEWPAMANEALQDEPPLLLWIAREDPDQRERVMELWWRAWENGVRRDRLRRALGSWLRFAEQRQSVRTTLDLVVDTLAAKGARWRLLLWMDEWARDPRGPYAIAREFRSRLSNNSNPAILAAVRAARATQRAGETVGRRVRQVAD